MLISLEAFVVISMGSPTPKRRSLTLNWTWWRSDPIRRYCSRHRLVQEEMLIVYCFGTEDQVELPGVSRHIQPCSRSPMGQVHQATFLIETDPGYFNLSTYINLLTTHNCAVYSRCVTVCHQTPQMRRQNPLAYKAWTGGIGVDEAVDVDQVLASIRCVSDDAYKPDQIFRTLLITVRGVLF
jgi:hypothetical protein